MRINPKLKHKTMYEDLGNVAVNLPLIPELQEIHPSGCVPLMKNPIITAQTMILGMFVLRPREQAWTAPILQESHPDSLYRVQHWIYNVTGLEGGWLIAHNNLMDAYRLALQYALADAVIVGSNTVREEGIDRPGHKGYIWHPYHPTSWHSLQQADPDLLRKILLQRQEWQRLGYLSGRNYPAQIVVTASGKATTPDLLEAAIFHQYSPDGSPIEAYILTSQLGASRLKERASQYGLAQRIEQLLISLSPLDAPERIDLNVLPTLLYQHYNIRIANHDGGATVLSEFSQAGILPQLNLTLTRQHSLKTILETTSDPRINSTVREDILTHLSERTACFFRTSDGSIPQELVPISILSDAGDEAAVVIFDTSSLTHRRFC